jgi:DTW domain-containing protein YfiP
MSTTTAQSLEADNNATYFGTKPALVVLLDASWDKAKVA